MVWGMISKVASASRANGRTKLNQIRSKPTKPRRPVEPMYSRARPDEASGVRALAKPAKTTGASSSRALVHLVGGTSSEFNAAREHAEAQYRSMASAEVARELAHSRDVYGVLDALRRFHEV